MALPQGMKMDHTLGFPLSLDLLRALGAYLPRLKSKDVGTEHDAAARLELGRGPMRVRHDFQNRLHRCGYSLLHPGLEEPVSIPA